MDACSHFCRSALALSAQLASNPPHVQVLLGGKPTPLDTPWKPARDTEHILAAVAAAQARHWPVLDGISTPESFSKAWEFYLLGKQTAASLQVKRSPRTRSASKRVSIC